MALILLESNIDENSHLRRLMQREKHELTEAKIQKQMMGTAGHGHLDLKVRLTLINIRIFRHASCCEMYLFSLFERNIQQVKEAKFCKCGVAQIVPCLVEQCLKERKARRW